MLLRYIVCVMVLCLGITTSAPIYSQVQKETTFEWAKNRLMKPSSDKVPLVAAHRADWRGAPENSLQGIKNCIEAGVDIAEIDLGRTKDGHLILMHDVTIDRTTTGKGKPEDFTLEEIRKFNLRAGTGHKTRHVIPTLEEALVLAKGKVLLCLDKNAYIFFKETYDLVKKHAMIDQVMFNVYNGLPYDTVKKQKGSIDPYVYLMIIVSSTDPATDKVIKSYEARPRTIIQTVFNDESARILPKITEIRKRHHVWFNSLWPEHSAGHDDDIAVEENKPDTTWGWLIEKGGSIIQSDRPFELLSYLRKKWQHP